MRKYFLYCAVTVVIVGCAMFGNDPSQGSATYLNSAQLNLKNRHYQQALESATMAVNSDSRNYLGYYLQAQAYQNLHQESPANLSYQKALDLNKHDINLLTDYATFLCAKQNYPQAATLYDSAVQNAMQNNTPATSIYINWGDCFANQNRLDDAIDNYSKALQDENAPLTGYLGIANAYVLQRNYATAYYYMSLYHGGDNVASLEMKIMTLSALLKSSTNMKDSQKLKTTLMTYQKQLQQLSPAEQESDVLTPLNEVAVAAPPELASSNTTKKVVTLNSPAPETKPQHVAQVSNKGNASYPDLAPRIRATSNGRHYVIVEAGDTLYNLAVRSNTTPAKLMQINNIKQKDIQIGRRVYLD